MVLLGATVPSDMVAQWSDKLSERMPEAALEVVQNDGPSGLEDLQRMVNLYAEGQTALSLRDAELVKLRTAMANMRQQELPASLPAEILAQHKDIVTVEVANRRHVERDGGELMVPWIHVTHAPQDSTDTSWALEQQLGAWLLLRLDTDTLALEVDAARP